MENTNKLIRSILMPGLLYIIASSIIIITLFGVFKELDVFSHRDGIKLKNVFKQINEPFYNVIHKSGRLQLIFFYIIGIAILVYGVLIALTREIERVGVINTGVFAKSLLIGSFSFFVVYELLAFASFIIDTAMKSALNSIEKLANSIRTPVAVSLIIPTIIHVFFHFGVLSTSRLEIFMLVATYTIHLYAIVGLIKTVALPQIFASELGPTDRNALNIELIKSVLIWFFVFISILYLEVSLTSSIYPEAFIYSKDPLVAVSGKFDLFYYVMVSFSTIGFGDITPNTLSGKLSTLSIISSSLVFLILFVSSSISRLQSK